MRILMFRLSLPSFVTLKQLMMFITNIIKMYHEILEAFILYGDKEIFIMGNIFDYSNGEFIFGNLEGDSFMSQDGHLMSRMSDTSMLDCKRSITRA